MTSYINPLSKIDQSIPRGNMVISTVFGSNESRNKRTISFRYASKPCAPLKIKSKGFKNNSTEDILKVAYQHEKGMLKAKILELEAPKSEILTDLEKTIFLEGETSKKTPRVSVFQRLAIKTQPRISVFQRLGKNPSNKPQGSKKWKVKRHTRVIFKTTCSKTNEDTEESVNCISFKEGTSQDQGSSPINEEEQEFINNAQPAPLQMEDGGQATVDDLQEINLGTAEEPKPIFVSALLTLDELQGYKSLLQDYKDVFAWSYQDMPGLDPNVAVHRLAVSDKTVGKTSSTTLSPETRCSNQS